MESRTFELPLVCSYQPPGYVAMVFLPWLFADYIQVRTLVLITLLMAFTATSHRDQLLCDVRRVDPADARRDCG